MFFYRLLETQKRKSYEFLYHSQFIRFIRLVWSLLHLGFTARLRCFPMYSACVLAWEIRFEFPTMNSFEGLKHAAFRRTKVTTRIQSQFLELLVDFFLSIKEAFQTSIGLRLYVLDWNVIAQNFYKRLGAHSNKDKFGLHVYRFDKDALSKM